MSILISTIIPARNEADRIAQTVKGVKKCIHLLSKIVECQSEIILVDDASNDRTGEIAQKEGDVKVVSLQKHSGKGAALRRGVTEAKGNILLFVDADLGKTAEILWEIVVPVLEGKADMTIAAPPPDQLGGFGIVKKFASQIIWMTTGFKASAPLSGQRALRREVLGQVIIADGYGVETALTIDAVRAGFQVIEVPINFKHRALGKSLRGFWHRAKQLSDIARAVLPKLFRR